MDQRDIVVLDDTCFHLPSLYDWVINREQNRNPFTNLPFSEENLARLMEVATERHPLTLTIHTLQGNRVIQTTSLMQMGMLWQIVMQVNTLHGALSASVQRMQRLRGAAAKGIATTDLALVLEQAGLQLAGTNEYHIWVSQRQPSYSALKALRAIEVFFQAHEWPTNNIVRAIESMRPQVNPQANRSDQARAALQQHPQRQLLPSKYAYYRIRVQLHTTSGDALGIIPIFVPRDPVPTIETLMARLNERYEELGLLFPPREYLQVIIPGPGYTNRTYPDDTPISGNLADQFTREVISVGLRYIPE
jgi:hypothetical protein